MANRDIRLSQLPAPPNNIVKTTAKAVIVQDGKDYIAPVTALPGGGGGSGNVVGPGSSTTNAVVRFDNTDGATLKNSSSTLSDAGLFTTASIRLTGVSVSQPIFTDASGNLVSYANNTALNFLLPDQSGQSGKVLSTDGSTTSWTTAGVGSGDVVGPASATDNAAVRFDSTTGKLVQNSTIILSDAGNVSAASITLSGLTASLPVFTDGSKNLSTLTANDALNALLPVQAGQATKVLQTDGTNTAWAEITGGTGIGDVTGPASSTDRAVARYNSTTGKILYNSTAILADDGTLTTSGAVFSGLTASLPVFTDGSKALISQTAQQARTAILPTQSAQSGKFLTTNGTDVSWATVTSGDVVGPASSTDNALVRFDLTTGKLVQNSTATLSDAGVLSTTGVLLSGLTASLPVFTDSNKNLISTTTTDARTAILPSQTGNSGKVLTTNGTDASWSSVTGTGDVVGPASATDNAITRFDTTTGKLLQNSSATVSDTGIITASNYVASGLTASLPVFTDGSSALSTLSVIAARTALLPSQAGNNAKVLTTNGTDVAWSATGTGTVSGPVSSVDNAVVRFDGTGGNVIQGSAVSISDAGGISAASVTLSGLTASLPVFTDGSKNLVTQTAQQARTAILPSQTSNNGKVLTTDGTDTSWAATVTGPTSVTLNSIVRYTATTGLTVGAAAATLSDVGVLTTAGANLTGLTASLPVFTDGSKNLVTLSATDATTALLPSQAGNNGKVLATNGAGTLSWVASAAASGDVVGPASATDNAIARFDTTTGKLLQSSAATISDAGLLTTTNVNITGVTASLPVFTDASKNLITPSASTAINALVPSQTGNSGKVLSTNGTVVAWASSPTTPGTTTLNAVPKYADTAGAGLLNSGVVIDSSNNVTTPGNITATGYLQAADIIIDLVDPNLPVFTDSNKYLATLSAQAARTALLPSQAAQGGKFLTTNGTDVSWATGAGGITASSVDTLTNKTLSFASNTIGDGVATIRYISGYARAGGCTLLSTNNGQMETPITYQRGILNPTTTSVTLDLAREQTMDASKGACFFITLSSSNITNFTLNNQPSMGLGTESEFFVYIKQSSTTARTVTWGTTSWTVRWPGGSAPTMTSTLNRVDIYRFKSSSVAGTWFGSIVGQNYTE